MEATVAGIRKLDFETEAGKTKMTQYFVTIKQENVDGHGVDKINWNELENGQPPKIAVGQIIQAEYNHRGKLRIISA